MKLWKICCLLTALLLQNVLVSTPPAQADQFSDTTGKKLIEYGWDEFYAPDPAFIRDHIVEMENSPFEGIAFRLPGTQSNIFKVANWQPDQQVRNEQLQILESIQWNKFTDNFLTIYSSSDMDWFSDNDWQKVLSKVQFMAKAAKKAGCVGIVFDPESYGGSPWKYAQQTHADIYTFDDYWNKAYQRGQEFINAMQGELPNLKLLMFYQYSGVLWESHSSDPAVRKAALQQSNYGLMIPFLDGVLSEAGNGVQLIDGNEDAYYYKTPANFDTAYQKMTQDAKINVPETLWNAFDQHVRAGSSLYVDQIYGLRPHNTTWRPPVLAWNMTQEQRNKWFEHNVYYALKTSDEYVWLYDERMDWFNHPDVPGATGNNKLFRENDPPEGIVDAITSAKNKLENNEPLGYSMEPIYEEVQEIIDNG